MSYFNKKKTKDFINKYLSIFSIYILSKNINSANLFKMKAKNISSLSLHMNNKSIISPSELKEKMKK
jgi:hypothetical protein